MRPINYRVDEDITKAWIEYFEEANAKEAPPIKLKLTQKQFKAFNLNEDKIFGSVEKGRPKTQENFFIGVWWGITDWREPLKDMAVAYYMEDDVLYANYRIRFPDKEDDFFVRKIRINSPQDIPPSLHNIMENVAEQYPHKAKFLKFNHLYSIFMNYRGGVL